MASNRLLVATVLAGDARKSRPTMGLAMAISSMVVAVLTAAPAHAAYKVAVMADSRNGLYGDYGRGYNISSFVDGSPGGPGFTSEGGACGSSFSACNIGGYGNTQTNPNLTAVREATSVSVTTMPSSFFPQGLSASASAYAKANLARGTVGIADQGTYGSSDSGQAGGGNGVSTAGNYDTLHFSVAGASAQTVTTIGVTFHVDGTTNAFTPAGDSTADLNMMLQLGGGSFQGNVFSGPGTGYAPVLSEGPPPSGWLTESLSPASPGDFTFHGTLALMGATQDLGVVEYLYGNCGIGTACDYSHTASLSLSLPGNVTYTSDSGVFLSHPNGVPEPAAWALLMTGVAAVGGLTRRRRAAPMVA
jgi:hypothetical protein